ncbi:MAG: DUF2203 family protein [Pedosphaera sp.]|nr:DUF2203 family protein [Pedosphaera sp.]
MIPTYVENWTFRESSMSQQFNRHYTVAEAQALLPQVRLWLRDLRLIRQEIDGMEERFREQLCEGADLGGRMVNEWVRRLLRLRELFFEFTRREIQIKDFDRGLIDFPFLRGDREVFLCWEEDDDDIEFWHDLDTGYAGREKL